MLNTKTSALGIIFPNSYDALIPELVNVRLMASIPFASRYRLIDFTLSSMANCDIDNVSVLAVSGIWFAKMVVFIYFLHTLKKHLSLLPDVWADWQASLIS